jgi:hypothetical protein
MRVWSVECKEIVEKIESHENLEVWQMGIKLVKLIYLLTDKFPDKEW